MRNVDQLARIGFYTLSDARAKQCSVHSPLWRCELLITSRCNFSCPYCRGVQSQYRGDMPCGQAIGTIQYWASQGLRNIRFSGGEPTLHKELPLFVKTAKNSNINRIAISTNGSASREKYDHLIDMGANDFSISLDACCATTFNKMIGKQQYSFDTLCETIRHVASRAYTTVGVVATEGNAEEMVRIINMASGLGVADIRIITAAQTERFLSEMDIAEDVLAKHPILKYRLDNAKKSRPVRGLHTGDSSRCSLVLDDMAVIGNDHYPCIIYLREGGKPIGQMTDDVRGQRERWSETHRCDHDPICRKNCLDVCVDYNNTVRDYRNQITGGIHAKAKAEADTVD